MMKIMRISKNILQRNNEEKISEADFVSNMVRTWLGNPISRGLLRYVSKRNENGSKIELAMRKYVGDDVKMGIDDKLVYLVVKYALEKGADSFGFPREELKKSLKEPVVRRGMVNILEGIAEFGVQTPQTTAAPFLIVWDFTHRCNLKCKHCYQDADQKPFEDELSTEEAKAVIDQLFDIGVVAIAFSGGEPLARPDFFEIAEYAKSKDFYVAVASNGTLITPKIAKKLKKVVDYIEISLDGFEKTHDSFRGMPNAWKLACRGIKNCVAAGIDTCVATTVTRLNYKEIPKLIEFVEKDLKARRMIFFNFVPTKRGKEIMKYDIEPREREKLLKFLYSKLIDKECKLDIFSTAPQYARIAVEFGEACVPTHFVNKDAIEMLKGRTKTLSEFIGGCGCARLYAALEPNGDIYPCVFLPLKVGNIRENSFKEIWKNSDTLKKLRDRNSFKGCGACKFKNICGGCRARAYGYFGDLQGPDPGCIINQRYWEELKNA